MAWGSNEYRRDLDQAQEVRAANTSWPAIAHRDGFGQVFGGKETPLALKPLGKGFVCFTLRSVAEVRPAAACFEDVAERSADAAQVVLARRLIESKSGALNLANFADRYQAAVLDLIKAKVEGTAPVLVPRSPAGQVASLMEALRQSVAQAEATPQPVLRRNGRKRLALAA